MRKPAHLKRKILLFCLFGCFLGLWMWLEIPCIPRLLTGVICPGCGMSRAWSSFLHLDLRQAFYYHPMFWSVPLLALYILYDGKLFLRPRLNTGILILLLVGYAVSYGIRLFVFLGGEMTI